MTFDEWLTRVQPDTNEWPIGVRLWTNDQNMPTTDPGLRITRVELAGVESSGSLVREDRIAIWEGLPPLPLPHLIELLRTHAIVTPDVEWTAALVATKWQIMPLIVGEVTIAERLLKLPLSPVALFRGLDWRTLYRELLKHYRAIDKARLLLPYRLDLLVASHLAHASAVGYTRDNPDGWFHPTWKVRSETGSGRITSSNPSISTTKHSERYHFAAQPFRRWIGMRWVDAEITLMAARSGDPFFTQLAQQPNPYEALAEYWMNVNAPGDDMRPDETVTAERAREIMLGIIAAGSTPTRLAARNVLWYFAALAAAAPEWAKWVERTRSQALAYKGVCTPLGVVVEANEENALPRDLQETEAECLKMFLGQLLGDVERLPDTLTGFSSCIPIYARVYFQIDSHIPIDRIVTYLERIAGLEPGLGLKFKVAVEAGPRWGDMQVVTRDLFSQTAADLSQRTPVPLRCPLCRNVAPDEPTLREHLSEMHRVLILSEVVREELIPEAIERLVAQAYQPEAVQTEE